jgi:hypothetical protein
MTKKGERVRFIFFRVRIWTLPEEFSEPVPGSYSPAPAGAAEKKRNLLDRIYRINRMEDGV